MKKKANNVYIVRHGQSEGNVDDTVYQRKPDYALNLTKEGEIQARAAGKKLRDEIGDKYVGFYSSPYFRTRQTRYNILKSFTDNQVKYSFDDTRLREQEWGNLQPQTTVHDYEEIRDKSGRFFYRFADGESGGDVHDRCKGFLETLYRDFAKGDCPDNIVIVCHGYQMRVLISAWLHYDFQKMESIDNPKNCEIIKLTLDDRNHYKVDDEYNPLSMKWRSPFEYTDTPNG